jgi:hypothetical protein
MSIEVASGVPLTQPAFYWLDTGRARRGSPAEPTSHRLGRAVTSVQIGTPAQGTLSDAARVAEALGLLAFERSADYVLDLTLDGAPRRASTDLTPVLPIRLRW